MRGGAVPTMRTGERARAGSDFDHCNEAQENVVEHCDLLPGIAAGAGEEQIGHVLQRLQALLHRARSDCVFDLDQQGCIGHRMATLERGTWKFRSVNRQKP